MFVDLSVAGYNDVLRAASEDGVAAAFTYEREVHAHVGSCLDDLSCQLLAPRVADAAEGAVEHHILLCGGSCPPWRVDFV